MNHKKPNDRLTWNERQRWRKREDRGTRLSLRLMLSCFELRFGSARRERGCGTGTIDYASLRWRLSDVLSIVDPSGWLALMMTGLLGNCGPTCVVFAGHTVRVSTFRRTRFTLSARTTDLRRTQAIASQSGLPEWSSIRPSWQSQPWFAGEK